MNAKKRLTALEALKLAKPTSDMEVDAALQQIEFRARAKHINAYLNSSFWVNKYSKDWEDAKKQLESLGYKVAFTSIRSPIVEEEPEEYTYVEWRYAHE